ncbi:hypothetical protein RJ639_042751, partial [Escallonia herrerae]
EKRDKQSGIKRDMGRSPCCSKEGLNTGAWTAAEDKILSAYIKAHGEGNWRSLPKRAGTLHLWSLIAGRLPGRTDNEIKNYWNTTLGKKVSGAQSSSKPWKHPSPRNKSELRKPAEQPKIAQPPILPPVAIRTKAHRCTKVLLPTMTPPESIFLNDLDLQKFGNNEFPAFEDATREDCNNDLSIFKDWTVNDFLDENATMDLGSLESLLYTEEWSCYEDRAR